MVGLNLQSDFVKSPNNHLYGEEPGAGRSVGIEWVLTELSCDFGKSRGFSFSSERTRLLISCRNMTHESLARSLAHMTH